MTLLPTCCTAVPVCELMRYSKKPVTKCLWSVVLYGSDSQLLTASRVHHIVSRYVM